MEKAKKQIKIFFIVRICLWVIAAVSTLVWIWYSIKLHRDGIFDPYEYATLLRPVFYTCLIISFVAICVSFLFRKISLEIKRQNNIR